MTDGETRLEAIQTRVSWYRREGQPDVDAEWLLTEVENLTSALRAIAAGDAPVFVREFARDALLQAADDWAKDRADLKPTKLADQWLRDRASQYVGGDRA